MSELQSSLLLKKQLAGKFLTNEHPLEKYEFDRLFVHPSLVFLHRNFTIINC